MTARKFLFGSDDRFRFETPLARDWDVENNFVFKAGGRVLQVAKKFYAALHKRP